MDARALDPSQILRHLERRLADLEASGVRWLSIAPHPDAMPSIPMAPMALGAPEVPAVSQALAALVAPVATAGLGERPHAPGEAPREAASSAPASEGAPAHPASLATLEALRLAYRDCRACKLCETRDRLVFGVGHERPALLFIGEGPGADEDRQGLPFVGRAGALLNGLIRAAGLVREDVYITNVVKCRPPGNRNPEPDEVARCRPILERQIELLDPRLIVTLGNVPLKVLKPNAAGITRERGATFSYRHWQVLPTFHPSYLLRNPAAIESCWADFRLALRVAFAGR